MNIRTGDILVFKRAGPLSFVLGGLLWLVEHLIPHAKPYDFWGWHTAIVVENMGHELLVLESIGSGVQYSLVSSSRLGRDIRVYRVLPHAPSVTEMNFAARTFIGKPYDVAVYFWTAAQYLIRHFWNRRIPKLLDGRYTCWELVTEILCCFGVDLVDKYDCPILSDILRNPLVTEVSLAA
jgi:hypothetical protein